MNVAHLNGSPARFKILQTSARSQTAVMTLAPGGQSSEAMNVHEKSDQILMVVEGEVQAEVGGERRLLRAGDICLVEAGSPHRFRNSGKDPALTFNVYTPPEYPEHKESV